ncbi:MAG: hypothetical protein KF842_01345 [Caulobacter sp.]|nr:hypothetical protein [Caulobacter sp.]
MSQPNSPGRKANDAEPLGKSPGLRPEKEQDRTARRERRSAGPDGPDATEVGDLFKTPPPPD